MYARFRKHVLTTVDGTGLAVFRILICLPLLGEVLQQYYFRHLSFDPIPYVFPHELDFVYAYPVWIGALVMLTMGLHTRVTSIMNYAFCLVFFATLRDFEYHMMYIWMGLSFIMMFLPLGARLSVDNLRRRAKNGGVLPKGTHRVSKAAYTIPMFWGIAIVYFDSVLFKGTSQMWLDGLGLWAPASMPQFVVLDWTPVLNQKWLMNFLGYVTLVFEAAFLFIFWVRRLRAPLFVVGVGLHLGILVFFPIPWFALGVSALYTLMIPSSFWGMLKDKFCKSGPRTIMRYNPDRLDSVRAKSLVHTFDVCQRLKWVSDSSVETLRYSELRGEPALIVALRTVIGGLAGPVVLLSRRWIAGAESSPVPNLQLEHTPPRDMAIKAMFAAMFLGLFMQVNSSSHTPMGRKAVKAVGLNKMEIYKHSPTVLEVSKSLFGITPHGVFMENVHVLGYNHIIAVVHVDKAGKETWLPMIGENGRPQPYLLGGNWASWTFRTNHPRIHQGKLSRGIRRYTAFWATKNDVSLRNAHFEIRVKKIVLPLKWRKDALKIESAKPWISGGSVTWKNSNYIPKIKNIERL